MLHAGALKLLVVHWHLRVMLTFLPLLLVASLVSSDPAIEYRLKLDPADSAGVSVEIRIRNAPANLQLAAHAHPEYDDKYWRHLKNLAVAGATVTPVDSVRWQLNNPAGDVVISYRVDFPREGSPRSAWKPFVSPTGGLVGGPHSFLYVVGLEKSPATVTLDIPPGWKVGTGLEGQSTARTFTAPNIFALMESPMLVGPMSEWKFLVSSVPHRVFYWRKPNGAAFDSVAFLSGIEKLANQSYALFGAAPYREYSFLIQDDAWSGGLEHPNSVTLGAESEQLAKDHTFSIGEIAHEFFHTWNLMAIKPAGYREVDYRMQQPVAGLWFSEGLTIYYADLLRRRAGLPAGDSTRTRHLEYLIERYLGMPGLAKFSAETIGLAEYNSRVDALGDYVVSGHLMGEVLGNVFDIAVRDATDGRRSMDDVMRLMYSRRSSKGFVTDDIRVALDEACACQTKQIFDRHVSNAGAIDFDHYLGKLGLRAEIKWVPATRPDGTREADLRAWAWEEESDKTLRLRVGNPNSIWAKAGLHTGDVIVSANGNTYRTWPEFRNLMRALKVGDSVTMVVRRRGETLTRRVAVTGYDRPTVSIRSVISPSARQLRLREAWASGK